MAAFVSSHLRQHGIEVTLTGGSCVTIFSRNQYVSADLDFIEPQPTSRRKLRQALAKIGYLEENRYFKNPDTRFIAEFPAGPLAVGEEPVKEEVTLEYETGTLRLISPTDCVKDRLAAYFHWGDRQGLAQAVLVTQNSEVDLSEVERWAQREGKLKESREIKGRLTAST